jgi:hypothetical protein
MGYFELTLIIFGLTMLYEFISPRVDDSDIHDQTEEVALKLRKRNNTILIMSLIGLLIFLLTFHVFLGNDGIVVFPKSVYTFKNTIITQSDINQLIDKYNNASIFERLSIQNDPFFKMLMDKGLIKVNTIFDK